MHAHMTMVQAGAKSARDVRPLLLSSLLLGSPADKCPLCRCTISHAMP